MSGKQKTYNDNIKTIHHIRNAIIAQDLYTLKNYHQNDDYNSFTSDGGTILTFAALNNATKELFSFLLEKTNLESQHISLKQLLRDTFSIKLKISYVISLLKSIDLQSHHAPLKEKISMEIGSVLLNALMSEPKDTFIAWLLSNIRLDASALELAIKAKSYDTLNLTLKEMYTRDKQTLPFLNLDQYLSEAIKKEESTCAELLLLYGGTPNHGDIEAIQSAAMFITLSKFGYAAGRFFKLNELAAINNELKDACLVGAYNNNQPIVKEELSAILDENDLHKADNELNDSPSNLLARVLTDWTYWFHTLEDPLFVYDLIENKNTLKAIFILNESNSSRLAHLKPFLNEAATNTNNALLKKILTKYVSTITPSLKEIALEAIVNLINNQHNSDDAIPHIGSLPEQLFNTLKNDSRLEFAIENSETNKSEIIPPIRPPAALSNDILLAFIKQMDDLLEKLKNNVGLLAAFKATLKERLNYQRIIQDIQSDLDLRGLPLITVAAVAVGVLFFLLFALLREIYIYRHKKHALFNLLCIVSSIISCSFMLLGTALGTVVASLTIQRFITNNNQFTNKDDAALYFAAIAAHCHAEQPDEAAKLAELAVALFNKPENKKCIRILEEAKVILDTLNSTLKKDLPINFKSVTVYPKTENIVRLGDFQTHITLFPSAKAKMKNVTTSERTPLLAATV